MAILKATIVASPAGILLRLAVLLGVAVLATCPALAQQAAPDLFVDVSQEAGIGMLHEATWEEFSGEDFTRGYLAMGQAWGDYDNDLFGGNYSLATIVASPAGILLRLAVLLVTCPALAQQAAPDL